MKIFDGRANGMSAEREMETIDDAIFLLYSQGIITFNQRRSCDKKMYKKIKEEGVNYYKKIREEHVSN